MAGLLTDFGIGGVGRVTSLPCGFGWNSASPVNFGSPGIQTLSGACTGGAWKSILSITGSPVRLNALMMSCVDATARTVQLRITIDGVVVFNNSKATSSAMILVAVGQVIYGLTNSLAFQPVDAASSLLVEYQGNLSETDKVSFNYNYELR